MSDTRDAESDKTPILLHPARRLELLRAGQDLFNEEQFFEAHEQWEDLWNLEYGRDKGFIQALIQVAAHFVHVRKGNWSGAESVGRLACEKFIVPPTNRLYRELDVVPLTSAIGYNLRIMAKHASKGGPPPVPDAFMVPKLFEK